MLCSLMNLTGLLQVSGAWYYPEQTCPHAR